VPRGSFGSVMMFVGAFLWGVAWTAYAGDTELMAVGLRGGLSVKGSSPLGEEQRRVFAAGDALAMWRLPWSWYGASGWGVGTRLLASVGVLEGEGATAGVLTAVPLIAFGDRDGRVTLDAGAGGALLTRHRFGLQDFGGPFQFVGTAGLSAVLIHPFTVGYRFQHYSDGTIYGRDSRGVDLHMIEWTYRF